MRKIFLAIIGFSRSRVVVLSRFYPIAFPRLCITYIHAATIKFDGRFFSELWRERYDAKERYRVLAFIGEATALKQLIFYLRTQRR